MLDRFEIFTYAMKTNHCAETRVTRTRNTFIVD